MSVRRDGQTVRLEGDCHVEDAEPLAALLEAREALTVDLCACTRLHSAVVQVLLVFRPTLEGEPANALLAHHLLPALRELWPLQATQE